MEIEAPDGTVTAKEKRPGRDEKGRFIVGHANGWTPGVSGSVFGRRDCLLDHIRKLGTEKVGPITRNAALAKKLWEIALRGRSQKLQLEAASLLLDRMHGKAPATVEIVDERERVELAIHLLTLKTGMPREEAQRWIEQAADDNQQPNGRSE